MKRIIRAALLTIICLSRVQAEKPSFTDDSSAYLRQVYKLKPPEFDIRHLTRIFNEISATAMGRQLIHLIFYRDGSHERHFYLLGVGMATEAGPDSTKEYLYPVLKQAPMYLADVVSIGENAVLEMRDPQHGVRRVVIAGNDPLHLSVKGEPADIIHIGYVPDFVRKPEFIPVVFVKTTAKLDPAWGLLLYRELTNRLRMDFALAVRNDTWFLGACVFPVFWAYGEPGSMPTMEEYWRTQSMSCEKRGGTPQCRVTSMDPRPLLSPPPILTFDQKR